MPHLLKHLHHHGGQLALASGRAEAVIQYAALPTKNPRRNKKYLETTQRPAVFFYISTVRALCCAWWDTHLWAGLQRALQVRRVDGAEL
jgi:hypothetical protein